MKNSKSNSNNSKYFSNQYLLKIEQLFLFQHLNEQVFQAREEIHSLTQNLDNSNNYFHTLKETLKEVEMVDPNTFCLNTKIQSIVEELEQCQTVIESKVEKFKVAVFYLF